jgi:hypothetical protein
LLLNRQGWLWYYQTSGRLDSLEISPAIKLFKLRTSSIDYAQISFQNEIRAEPRFRTSPSGVNAQTLIPDAACTAFWNEASWLCLKLAVFQSTW